MRLPHTPRYPESMATGRAKGTRHRCFYIAPMTFVTTSTCGPMYSAYGIHGGHGPWRDSGEVLKRAIALPFELRGLWIWPFSLLKRGSGRWYPPCNQRHSFAIAPLQLIPVRDFWQIPYRSTIVRRNSHQYRGARKQPDDRAERIPCV